ncbi:MAG: SIMPL domain-containing protein [Rhodobacteraceae bacterium]|nr:SIMPL domain-containing protein [Paracoccaceae bacterium]
MPTRFLALFAVLWTLAFGFVPASAAERTITVTGEGQVAAAPDLATVRLGVAVRADSARAAVTGMSDAMQQVMDAVTAAGIADTDVQTEGLNLGTVYAPRPEEGPPPAPEFEARTIVALKSHDIAGLGGLLDTLVSSGANELQGVTFGLTDPKSAEDDARRDAVADALAKAKLYAEAAGVTLGAVISITENGAAPGPVVMMRAAAAGSGVPIAEGLVAVTERVTVVLALGD